MNVERTKLETAGRNYLNLRGLYAIPAGVLCGSFGLANLGFGSMVGTAVFVVAFFVAAAAAVRISRYYGRTYGRVAPGGRAKARALLGAIVGAAVIIGGVESDRSFDLPLDLTAASFAAVMLGYYRVTVGLRAHHVGIWGALLVIGLVPAWGDVGADAKVDVGFLLMGVSSIVAGLLDHAVLRRSFGHPAAAEDGLA